MKYRIIVLIIFLCSCNSIQKSYYGTNQEMNFSNSNEYLNYLYNETGADTSKVIILQQLEVERFMDEVITKQLSMFYGIAFSDRFISASQLEVKSCEGAIKLLYNKIPNDLSDVHLENLDEYKLLNDLNLDKSKKTVIMIYSYKQGRFFKTKTSEIISDSKKDTVLDYRIISIDNIK